jgi:hypothetical protein
VALNKSEVVSYSSLFSGEIKSMIMIVGRAVGRDTVEKNAWKRKIVCSDQSGSYIFYYILHLLSYCKGEGEEPHTRIRDPRVVCYDNCTA